MNDSSKTDGRVMYQSLVPSVDLLVISVACHTAINRNVYKLFGQVGMSVVLVVPRELSFSSGVIKADLPAEDDIEMVYMDLLGDNSRIYRFPGIISVLNRYCPKIIVLDNDPVSLMALQIGVWSRKAKSKLYCISCENMSLSISSSFLKRGVKGIASMALKRILLVATRKLVYGVFTINNEGTQVFKDEHFANVSRIPLGFDPCYFHIDPCARRKKQIELNLSGFVIGYFGRITYEKGVHILISALEKLKDCSWTLLIDKFDEYSSEYGGEIHRRFVDAGLLDRLIFINPKHTEMGDYINAVDVVVIPSISTPVWIEQYGRVAAEAMACGKLVVASDSGALPMLLNGYGILFEEGNVVALFKILQNLIVTFPDFCHAYGSEEIAEYALKILSIEQQMKQMSSIMQESVNFSAILSKISSKCAIEFCDRCSSLDKS
jgi:glycosyltransferase involved in cell wall biosynthesis